MKKEPETAGLSDIVSSRHLAAWRSSFAWSGCGDSQPDSQFDPDVLVAPRIVRLRLELGNAEFD